MTYATEQRIVFLRQTGRTCREAAEAVGVSEGSVWHVMRKRGLAGRIREHRQGYQPPASIAAAIEEYGAVYIEAGLNGGYIATVEDVYTGGECGTVGAAIRSAAQKAGRRRE